MHEGMNEWTKLKMKRRNGLFTMNNEVAKGKVYDLRREQEERGEVEFIARGKEKAGYSDGDWNKIYMVSSSRSRVDPALEKTFESLDYCGLHGSRTTVQYNQPRPPFCILFTVRPLTKREAPLFVTKVKLS
jgi:hypothetical protein